MDRESELETSPMEQQQQHQQQPVPKLARFDMAKVDEARRADLIDDAVATIPQIAAISGLNTQQLQQPKPTRRFGRIDLMSEITNPVDYCDKFDTESALVRLYYSF
jgi:hypothetical protein